MIANYHSHTARCRHATGTQREYIEKAIEAGFRVFGFSDHTPYPFGGDYYSTFRMRPEELEGYVRETLDLKAEYRGDIDIRLGLEAEYYPKHFADLLRLCEDYPIEYFLLGQHATDNEYDGVFSGRPTDDENVLARYCLQIAEALSTGCFLYAAHPDIIRFTGADEVYEKHMRPLCAAMRKMNIPAEINFLGLAENRHYPDLRFWKIAGEEGVTAVLGVDAHSPERVYLPECEKRALGIAEKFGLRLLKELELPGDRAEGSPRA